MKCEHLVFFAIAFFISLIIIPIVMTISNRFNIYDYIDQRKIHKKNVSRLGGLAIFLGFFIPYIYFIVTDGMFSFNTYFYTAALLVAFLIGFLDDIFTIPARYKVLFQVLTGILVVLSGLGINDLHVFDIVTVKFGFISNLLTVLWIVMFMNAINLLDGMDGLASGIVFIANVFIFIIALSVGNVVVSMFSCVLAGAILGFYLFNFPPAKIFMGDGGAYFLGFIYATIPLMGIKKASVVTLFLFPIILLMIPLVDILLVIRKRLKSGYNIFLADKNHIHHRLLHLGVSRKGILGLLYYFTIILGVSSILFLHIKPKFTLLLLLLIFMIAFVPLYLLHSVEKMLEERQKKRKLESKIKIDQNENAG